MWNAKRKSGYAPWIVILGIYVFIGFGLPWIAERIDRWRFPWGYSGSKPSLTGVWVGPLVTRSGQQLVMLLDMELAPLDHGRSRNSWIRTQRNYWLEGRMLLCAESGRVQHFHSSGKPEDTELASRFRLSTSPVEEVPPDGLAPSHIQGKWNGQNSIILGVSFYMRKGKSAISDSDFPDTNGAISVALVRGMESDFTSLCNKLVK